MAGSTLAIVGIGLGVASFFGGRSAAKKQADAQRRMAEAQERQAALEKKKADIANARTLRSALRSSRIAQGNLINTGFSMGLEGSSSFQGGLASLGSQEGAQRGYFGQMAQFNEGIFKEQVTIGGERQAYGAAGADAAQWASIGQVAGLATQLGSPDQTTKGAYREAYKGAQRLFGVA